MNHLQSIATTGHHTQSDTIKAHVTKQYHQAITRMDEQLMLKYSLQAIHSDYDTLISMSDAQERGVRAFHVHGAISRWIEEHQSSLSPTQHTIALDIQKKALFIWVEVSTDMSQFLDE